MPQWLIVLSWVAIGLGLATGAAIALDVTRHPQRMKIMNIVWPVTGLYFPVVGWWIYSAMGGPRAADAEPTGEKPRWKSVFLSSTHCGSGCVLGDIIGAPIVLAAGLSLAGERLFAEYVVEFAIAYLFGIAFQYLPIRAMRKIPAREAVLDAMKADTLSLTAFEVGMFAWMAVVSFLLFESNPHAPMLDPSCLTCRWHVACASGRGGIMAAKLNHTIVAVRDRDASALFLSDLLGLDPPVVLGPFALVTVGDELTLDFVESPGEIKPQHYAFLVSETEFDQIFARIESRRLPYWADPHRSKRDQINHWDDGRGVYFEEPSGHLLEILTRSYGSAGTAAQNPHPLVAERLEPKAAGGNVPDTNVAAANDSSSCGENFR